MNFNPFNPNIIYINDPEDFKMPYQLYGKTDIELMVSRYMKLNNKSYGYIVRFSNQIK